jgi:hypothetical protein
MPLKFPVPRLRRLLTVMSVGVTLAGCSSLDVTNPNQQSSQSFWKTADDANRGLTSVYNGLLPNGTFGRWQAFANDIRSDIGTARMSPWGDLGNFNAFQLSDYNFEVNRELWTHNYELISRANLVIANVPGMSIDPALRSRMVAEAKFLRGLAYYNLVTLFENVPLVSSPPLPTDRPATAAPSETWALIEKDFSDAAADLPVSYSGSDVGRATKGAAQGMLGKARLQQRKWAEASQALSLVITGGRYSLLPNYADNFTQAMDNVNPESLFEVQMEDMYPIVTGVSFPKMIGPCRRSDASPQLDYNPTYCDGRPTRWYFDEFSKSKTAAGLPDPRLDATILYNRPDRATEMVYDKERAFYFQNDAAAPNIRLDTMLFFRKYGETYLRQDQRWDNPINYKVLRYADVLLMQAEALNEQSQTGAATPFINQVRRRVGKSDLGTLTTAQMRDTILYERMFELGLESSRFNDLRRQNLLTPALAAHDRDFATGGGAPGFVAGKSERLPIPVTETNLNPNVKQNPGW